jgi:hypothetical protein
LREEEEIVQAPKEKKKKNKIPQLGTDVVEEATDDGFITVGAGGKAVLYTAEGILKHLRAIVEQRGRKNSDKLEHIRTLEKLFDVAVNDYQKVRVLLTLISTRFDLTDSVEPTTVDSVHLLGSDLLLLVCLNYSRLEVGDGLNVELGDLAIVLLGKGWHLADELVELCITIMLAMFVYPATMAHAALQGYF